MKITSFAALPLRQRVASGSLNLKFGAFTTVESVVYRITADNGETGYGVVEATPPMALPSEAILAISRLYGSAVIGADALDPLAVMTAVDGRLFDLNYSVNPIRAGIDAALHDLAARIHGVPLSSYLGATSTPSVDVLELLPLAEPELMEPSVTQALSSGIRALKVKMNGNVDTDLERVRRVRELAGPDVAILCDANQSYQRDEALRAATALHASSVQIFEQPLSRDDLDAMTWLTDASPIPIEADESVLSVDDAETVIARRAADCVSLRIARFGGIAQTMAVAHRCHEHGLAFRFGAMFAPSLYDATAAHVAAALPPSPYPQELAMHRLFLDDPFEGLALADGRIELDADRPGTGLTVKQGTNFIEIQA